MLSQLLRIGVAALVSTTCVLAQFPPTPEDVITKEFDNYSISYKQTTICETKAKAWSGYVHMPAAYLGDIVPANETVSLFFWYFEARHQPQEAPTGIYLAGGPGQTSMFGAAWDGGPCHVTPDSKDTVENPWSWNEYANMLYIDQPVGTGYSYNEIINSTFNLLALWDLGIVPFEAYNGSVPEQNATLLYGSFPSQDLSRTANTTEAAARTLWSFSQAWFSSFPEYKTCDSRISLWGNSYGGFWVPASAAYMQKQNAEIKAGRIEGKILHVDQIGILNGCIDMQYQMEWYPQMAYNNTYDLQIINETVYEAALHNYHKPKGCAEKIKECRRLGDESDPDQLGVNETVNAACLKAQNYCTNNIIGAFEAYSEVKPRSAFDMAQPLPDPFPQPYLSSYFNTAAVQADLGVPVNLTSLSIPSTTNMFGVTGDSFRRTGIRDIEYLLEEGVKVTLVYGDTDYRCPWLGVENVALEAEWEGEEGFGSSGYEEVRVNETYVGGVVKQFGGLSFTRVYGAGHHVVAYQPSTALQIFARSVRNLDIATGTLSTLPSHNKGNYSTSGPQSSYGFRTPLKPPMPIECNIYDLSTTCTVDQIGAYMNGTAVVEGWVVVKPAGGGGPLSGGSAF